MGGIVYSSPDYLSDISIEQVNRNLQQYNEQLCRACMMYYGSIAGAKKRCTELEVCLERAQADLYTIPWGSSKRLSNFQTTRMLEMVKKSGITPTTMSDFLDKKF